METLSLFRMATFGTICNYFTCEECRKIYNGYRGCPADLAKRNKLAVSEFVNRVDKILRERQSNNVFDWEPTDDELADIFMEAANDC